MQEETQNGFQAQLKILLADLEDSLARLGEHGPRVSGPQARLDQETFKMLAEKYPSRKYSHGVMHGFAQVINLLAPADLRRAALVVGNLRQAKGRHAVQVMMFKSELEEITRISTKAELSPSAVLEATTYLFVRAAGMNGLPDTWPKSTLTRKP